MTDVIFYQIAHEIQIFDVPIDFLIAEVEKFHALVTPCVFVDLT